jgi:hypothetical protein
VIVNQMWRCCWSFFFYVKGIVHHEFVPCGQTVNRQFYLEVLKCLREAEWGKRPEWWRNKTWMLYHDNAPAHTSLLICEFLAKHETTVVLQPPYFPDLAPEGFPPPQIEIHSERSLISDDRRARSKFAMGPMRYPTKRIPELEKTLESVYRQWRGVLRRRQVLLSCKLINKYFKKKVWFLFGQTTYMYLYTT